MWLGAVLLPALPDGVIVLPVPGDAVPLAEGRLAPAPPLDPVFELLDPELSQAAKAKAERSAVASNQLFLSITCLHSLSCLEMAKLLPDISPGSIDAGQ
ncbi:MAG TPA: hypothetical protein VJ747_14855 [Stellaceae bacterium]|nr:hypothetical protein [Stellaceae bacterium]